MFVYTILQSIYIFKNIRSRFGGNFPHLLNIRIWEVEIVESFNLSGKPDTYLKGESKRSVILTFNPLAKSSIVSIRGIILLLQISEIVDFGILVIMETWRTVIFLLYIYSCNKILMAATPFLILLPFGERFYSIVQQKNLQKRGDRMALITCTECGKEISDKASACPNCGCPIEHIKPHEEIKEQEYSLLHKILYGKTSGAKESFQKGFEKGFDNTNKLQCPKCGGHTIDLWSDSANMKEFQRTGLNLNPLHPLTPFKTKTIKKEKKSAAKIGLGIMTGGLSLLATGVNKKAHNEYFCHDCGYRWISK